MSFPPFAATVLAIAVAGTFLPDCIGLASGVFTASLLLAYALLGFAVLHADRRHRRPRLHAHRPLFHRRPVRLADRADVAARTARNHAGAARARRARAAAATRSHQSH
jgi:hypothetical protein